MIEDPADRHEGDRAPVRLLLTREEAVVLDQLMPLARRMVQHFSGFDPDELRQLSASFVREWLSEVERSNY